MAFNHSEVEKQAQAKWAELDLYRTDLTDQSKEKYYLLVEFPYPSGDLHIGHWYAFSVTDIYARLMRAKGYNVLFPIGFDAFGLPAENAAIKHGVDPKEWTYKNIERMRGQLASMGASFDWSKEVVACDPAYYHWTQWLFAKLFEHGLAERKAASVKWCPKDATVLANEQVVDGACERCGSEVEEKVLTQWFLKITQYADRLLSGLSELPWREEIKDAQRAWIGRSDGARISFPLSFAKGPAHNEWRDPDGKPARIDVFTTRPDTVFGATYLVLAPEHPWVRAIWDTPHDDAAYNKDEIAAYVKTASKKTERERSENKEKTGVKVDGITAINPATKEEIPIFVADYVLGSYGTGAVMAVPAHDERDFEFAKKHGLPIREVVVPNIIDRRNPPVEGKNAVERQNVHAIVKDPKTGKYLGLKWKKHPWTTFPMGGMEEGESAEAAARREVEEETGFTDLRLVRVLPRRARAEYFAAHKDENRVAYTTAVVFELESHAQKPRSQEESEQHDTIWLDESQFNYEHLTHAEVEEWSAQLAGKEVYAEPGVLVNSADFNGKQSDVAKWEIVAWLQDAAERATQYRIRDWSVSRQRYWGCPIPIVYDPEGKPHVVPSEHLPWLLPGDVDFKPTGEASPLASSVELKERVTRIFGEGWTPEYDTLDTFVDSSWYFMRYLDAQNPHAFSDTALMQKWLPVDRYSGGSEHTTMHLLYARFFAKALFDLGLSPVDEPFVERYNRGLIMGTDGGKMSKSKGNTLNPDEFVREYGADAVRLYLAFIGPYNEPRSYPWSLDGVAAMRKFLDRVERAADKSQGEGGEPPAPLLRSLARAAQKVEEESGRFKFNTAVAALMTFLNELEEAGGEAPRSVVRAFVVLLAPFAPHLSEHLWEKLGGEGSVHEQPWPVYERTEDEVRSVVVQVNGKRRGSVSLGVDAPQEEAVASARQLPAVTAALGGKEPSRVVYVPGKIINLVG